MTKICPTDTAVYVNYITISLELIIVIDCFIAKSYLLESVVTIL